MHDAPPGLRDGAEELLQHLSLELLHHGLVFRPPLPRLGARPLGVCRPGGGGQHERDALARVPRVPRRVLGTGARYESGGEWAGWVLLVRRPVGVVVGVRECPHVVSRQLQLLLAARQADEERDHAHARLERGRAEGSHHPRHARPRARPLREQLQEGVVRPRRTDHDAGRDELPLHPHPARPARCIDGYLLHGRSDHHAPAVLLYGGHGMASDGRGASHGIEAPPHIMID
mmetsp:Transcript_72629/g.228807  ORF Transcript_72629/g.228807 Transcript_72629/m.228807 type:complete len:231 (-) Transcript_72629:364-1056(-)